MTTSLAHTHVDRGRIDRAFIIVSVAFALIVISTALAADAGKTIAGIRCEREEYGDFHVHAHVDIFVDGKPHPVPEGIGMVGRSCLYWMHTHDGSGIIHIEAPVVRRFTLGQFMEIWRATAQGAPAEKEKPKVVVNGKRATQEWQGIEIVDLIEIAVVYGKDPAEVPAYYIFPLEYRKGPFKRPS